MADQTTFKIETAGLNVLREVVVIARLAGEELARCVLDTRGVTEVTVGSDPACGLHLAQKGVSRKHLTLQLRGGGVLARDLGSTNGTKFQGSKLTEAVLPPGSALMLGSVELRLEQLLPGEIARFGRLSTAARAMAQVLTTLARAAPSDVTVLLEGETGTGKDVLVRELHAESPRAAKRLETVDCGALPRELAAAELFGHEKGAFTGADRAREGALERAAGGTLFLDEIGELPLELQPLLLRALEARQVKHVGGSAFVPIDVRVVAATHRDLDASVAQATFRSDLLHRLAVVRVKVPRLTERLEDLPALVKAIIDDLGTKAAGLSLSPDTMQQLGRQSWPGNVRELRNFLERAVTLGDPGPLGAAGAAAPAAWPGDYRAAREQALDAFERDFARHVVARAHGNVSRAAREAGIGRGYLHRILKKHGLIRDR